MIPGTITNAAALQTQLRTIVGPEFVHAATQQDAIIGKCPQFVVEPANEDELAEVLRCANEAGAAVAPRGGGTKLSWGNAPSRLDIILSTARLNRIREHAWADLTVTVEAGCTVKQVQDALAKHGQRLALDALWPAKATVGGILSTNDSGALRIRYGSLRDLIIGVTLALPDGTLARSGGKVVKNVAGYDLPKLATGALGTLGVITQAVFRLYPLPRQAKTITLVCESATEANNFIARVLDSTLAFSALQARCIADIAPQIYVDVLFEGREAGVTAQINDAKSLTSKNAFTPTGEALWTAREELHDEATKTTTGFALGKMSALPNAALPAIAKLTERTASKVKVNAAVQATGLATVLLTGDEREVAVVAREFRENVEQSEGSFGLQSCSPALRAIDTWGNPGDALPLMRAVKAQLDPRGTLNPGRFVGGI